MDQYQLWATTFIKNEFMFSCRLMKMEMNDVLNGTKKININRVMTSPNGASDNSGSYMNAPKNVNGNAYVWDDVCTFR